MNKLFIDTHDAQIVIAIMSDDKVIDKMIKESSKNHSDFTMPMIRDILNNNKLTVHDLNEIIVVNGPGSFTGVRIGVTIAKTLAYTLNIPIKTISSLECFSISSDKQDKKLPIIRDVKGVFACLYDENNKALEEPFYKSNDEFKEYIETNNLSDSIIETTELDLDKINEYSKTIEPVTAHAANPIYIKVIEALKND